MSAVWSFKVVHDGEGGAWASLSHWGLFAYA